MVRNEEGKRGDFWREQKEKGEGSGHRVDARYLYWEQKEEKKKCPKSRMYA